MPQIITSGCHSEASATASVPNAASPAAVRWTCFTRRLTSKRACGSWSTTSTSGTLAIAYLPLPQHHHLGNSNLALVDDDDIVGRNIRRVAFAEWAQREPNALRDLLSGNQLLSLVLVKRHGNSAGIWLLLGVRRRQAARL